MEVDDASLRSREMDVTPRAMVNRTTILDLNDDCLKEVFAHMDPDDLAVVADVCDRFRQNSMHSARSKCKELVLRFHSSVEYSKLRNFGAFAKNIRASIPVSGRPDIQMRIVKRLSLYCVAKSIDLELTSFKITDDIAIVMEPLLSRAQKIWFFQCGFIESSPEYLATKMAELQKLSFSRSYWNARNVKFPKLDLISFTSISRLKNVDMEALLKPNPQLKRIHISDCDEVTDGVLELIAKYVPEVEEIDFTKQQAITPPNMKYWSQLNKLRSLSLEMFASDDVDDNAIEIDDEEVYEDDDDENAEVEDQNYYIDDDHSCVQTVHKIATANIALEVLNMKHLNLLKHTAQFIEGVSKLQKLTTLRLQFTKNFKAIHLIDSCKQLKLLSEIEWIPKDLHMTTDDLLKIVRNLESLQLFVYRSCKEDAPETAIVNGQTVEKLARIVRRREKNSLVLQMDERAITVNPADIIGIAEFCPIEERDHLLELKIC